MIMLKLSSTVSTVKNVWVSVGSGNRFLRGLGCYESPRGSGLWVSVTAER